MTARFRQLRRKHVKQMVMQPRSKPRHEAVDMKLYISKKTSKYVDFQQAGFIAICARVEIR